MSDFPAGEATQTSTGGENRSEATSITPEMVNEIVDKVYKMLLLELKYERERHLSSSHLSSKTKGRR